MTNLLTTYAAMFERAREGSIPLLGTSDYNRRLVYIEGRINAGKATEADLSEVREIARLYREAAGAR